MKIPAALIVYILVAVVSGVIKKLAEKKTMDEQRGRSAHDDDGVVPFDEIDSSTQIFPDDTDAISRGGPGSLFDTEFEVENWDKPDAEVVEGARAKKWRPNMAQAVIMSEILRSPRSKRPWPHR